MKGLHQDRFNGVAIKLLSSAMAVHGYGGGGGGGDDTAARVCTVCLLEFADGDELRTLPLCAHSFHMDCVDVWLRAHASCSLCRNAIALPSPVCAACACARASMTSSSSTPSRNHSTSMPTPRRLPAPDPPPPRCPFSSVADVAPPHRPSPAALSHITPPPGPYEEKTGKEREKEGREERKEMMMTWSP
uniref:RING-type E3 ubiquitin transferase n=1 Tax=Oryza rufipogon TaxID=4529 RepID=A0A0E0NK68_ORYRU